MWLRDTPGAGPAIPSVNCCLAIQNSRDGMAAAHAVYKTTDEVVNPQCGNCTDACCGAGMLQRRRQILNALPPDEKG